MTVRHGVTFHGSDGAAVNVKLHNWRDLSLEELEAVADDQGHPPGTRREFAAWYVRLTEDTRQVWADLAIEHGWECLRSDCRNIYGHGADVFSVGRSGGWAIVAADGRNGFVPEECGDWTAEDWQKWTEWERSCRDICAELPRSAAWLALVNSFEPMIEAREESRRFAFFYDAPPSFEVQA